MTEQDLHIQLKAALVLPTRSAALDVMTHIAAFYSQQGATQAAADIWAFVLLQAETPPETHTLAAEWLDDLATHVCPRVLWDAREFAQYATFADVVAYIFAPSADAAP